ncbi:hypothetical protein ACVWXM_000190 [Bradyrhizobium sp. GM7.3]
MKRHIVRRHIGGGWNTALVVGDAQSMIDDANGGNDTIVADAHGTVYTTVSAFGDVAGDMSGNAQGGHDDITGSIGWRGGANQFAGDAGGSMIDTSHGGNDTLDVSVLTMDGGATVSGDAIGALRGLAQGGNDNMTVTLNGDSAIAGATLPGDSSTSLMDLTQGGDDVLTVKIEGQYTRMRSRQCTATRRPWPVILMVATISSMAPSAGISCMAMQESMNRRRQARSPAAATR